MKKITFVTLMVLFVCTVFSQEVPLALRMDLVTAIDFHENMDSMYNDTVGVLSIQIKNYDVFQTPSGQYYIEFTNSNLVKSRKYLGYTYGMDHTYEGNRMFYSKDTASVWIWTVDRYGQIYKMDMPDFFAEDCKKMLKNMELKHLQQ